MCLGIPEADLQALDETVAFPDKRLGAIVRGALKKPEGPLTKTDLASLEFLEANAERIEDLSGLESCVNLDSLYLDANEITDVSPLAGLTRLYSLGLDDNPLSVASARWYKNWL